eukprot:14457238-Ditylum_brightwellii.AAC.1
MKGSILRKAPDNVLHYGVINTGKWLASAEAQMEWRLTYHSVPNKQKNFLCPIIFFIDGTHCDCNGRFQANTVLCSIGNINLQAHKDLFSLVFCWPTPNGDSLTCQKKSYKERDRFEISTTKTVSRLLQELLDLQSNDKENETRVAVTAVGMGKVFLHFE